MMANRKEALGIWLSDLLVGLALITFDRQVTGLSLDSRDVMAGDLFFAVSGANSHGLNFAVDAFNKGAIAIVYDPLDTVGFCDKSIASEVLIEIPQLSEKMGAIAARFYGKPSSKYCVIGVTGTNGKTSCVQFLQQCLPYSSSIGTLGWGTGKSLAVTKNTTPDAVELQRILAQLQGWGVRHVAMEVSSHGLQQKRVAGVSFDGVMITNITRDHLDYHGCMDNYVAAKLALLTVPEVRFAVVNFSGNFLEQILATIPENVRIWGVSFDGKKRGGVNVLDISAVTCYEGGLCFDVEYQSDRQGVTVPLYGEVNVENVAMVMAALLALGYSLREACVRVQKIQPIAGRMELFKSKKALPAVVVDYAHTPDALEKLLVMVRQHCEGVIWLVFGCGGDRDVGKRSQMGVIAEQFSDHVIVTNDNPRSESEQKIVRDIVSLCDDSKIEVIYDRRRAIRTAIEKAKKGDCVVVAGKGHEEYQELKGERIELSDRKIIAALVASEERSC
mgnify:FL=1